MIFDYPAKTFSMARPGTVTPRGERLPAPIGRTGFPRLELTIAGETQGFLLDTGATDTMISRAVLERWAAAQPAWPRAIGAVGMANMFGGKLEAEALMLRMPEATLGTLRIDHAAAVSRPIGTFEKFMSSLMTSPIVGAIGGNVLKQFRVEIDYASGSRPPSGAKRRASPSLVRADKRALAPRAGLNHASAEAQRGDA